MFAFVPSIYCELNAQLTPKSEAKMFIRLLHVINQANVKQATLFNCHGDASKVVKESALVLF